MDNDYEERIDREPEMRVRLRPDGYILGKSEKRKKEAFLRYNGECPRNEPYAYQDLSDLAYPFFIDAAQGLLVFIGRVGEEPVSASFTVVNTCNMRFWYKIKASSREMFKVQKPTGRLEKDEAAVISVIFYPGFQRPKAYCEYLHVYAMCDDDRDDNPFEAFGRLDRHHRPLKKRVYMDFIWHPHIELTRAFEYGHLLDIRKSKFEHDRKNKKVSKRSKPKNEEQQLSLNDVTYKHRQLILEKQLKHDIQEKHRLHFMNSDDMDKYITETAANKNRNKVAVVVKKPLEGYDRQCDYLERNDKAEYPFQLWEGFKADMATKGYNIPDKKLLKATLQQEDKWRKARAKAKEEETKMMKKWEEEEATRVGSKAPLTPKGSKTPAKSPMSKAKKGTSPATPRSTAEKDEKDGKKKGK